MAAPMFSAANGMPINMLTDTRFTPVEGMNGGMEGTTGLNRFDFGQFVPGGFSTGSGSGDSADPGGINVPAAMEWMNQSGYQLMQRSLGDIDYSYMVDRSGNLVGNPSEMENHKLDKRFLAAIAAAAAVTGGNVLAAGFGVGGAGTGAAVGGGGSAAAGSGTLEAMGGLTPVADAGAIIPTAGEYGALAGGAADGASAGLVGVDGVLTAAPGGGLFGGTAGGLLSGLPTGLTDALGTAGNFIKDNPRVVGGIVGGLLGGSGGGDDSGPAPYTGPMPTITRGAWKPQASAQMMQAPQYGLLQPQGKQQQNSGMGRYMGLLGG